MALGCAAATQARAESFFQIEAGIGAASYRTLGDDMYYQTGLSHHFDLHAPAWRVGIRLNAIDYRPGSWVPGVAFNLAYLNFGRVSITSMAAPDKDAYYGATGGYYNVATQSCAGPCRDVRAFASSGGMQAIALTIEPYWERGNWRFGLEAGPMLYRPTWDVSATNVENTTWWGPAGAVQNFHHSPRIELGTIVGASIAYKRVVVRYNYVITPPRHYDDTNVPQGWKGAHMLTVNYTF